MLRYASDCSCPGVVIAVCVRTVYTVAWETIALIIATGDYICTIERIGGGRIREVSRFAIGKANESFVESLRFRGIIRASST